MRLKVSERALVYVGHLKASVGREDLLTFINKDEGANRSPTEKVLPKFEAFRITRADTNEASTVRKLFTQSFLDNVERLHTMNIGDANSPFSKGWQ